VSLDLYLQWEAGKRGLRLLTPIRCVLLTHSGFQLTYHQALTLASIVDGWCQKGSIGTQDERDKFRKSQIGSSQTCLEILLRLVKGDRPVATPGTRSGFSGPLLEAYEMSVLPGPQHTHATLAVLALANAFLEVSQQANGADGREAGLRGISEIIQHFPLQQIYRVLETMFRDWRTTKKK
jgi:hypothetical protein